MSKQITPANNIIIKPEKGKDKQGGANANGEPTVTLPVSVLLTILASAGCNRCYSTKDTKELEQLARDLAKWYTPSIHPFPSIMPSLHKYPAGSGFYGFAFMDGTIGTETGKVPALNLLKKYQSQQMGAPAQFLLKRILNVVHAIMLDKDVSNTLFTFGKATCGKTPAKDGKTPYVRSGMVNRWRKYGPAGYKGMICLAMFDRENPQKEYHYTDPEAECVSLENLLHREFANHKYYHDGLSNSQSGSLSQRTHDDYYAVTYFAFGGKYETSSIPTEADTIDSSADGPSTRTRSRRKDNIRNPSTTVQNKPPPKTSDDKGKGKRKAKK